MTMTIQTGRLLSVLASVFLTAATFTIWYQSVPPMPKVYLTHYLRESLVAALPIPEKPRPFVILAYGSRWATNADVFTDREHIRPYGWLTTSRIYSAAVRQQVYGGSLLAMLRAPSLISGLTSVVLILIGSLSDARRNKVLREDGRKLRGRALLTPRQVDRRLNPWWKPRSRGLQVWTER